MNKTIQEKWKKGFLPGYDCITFGDGTVTIANTYSVILTETSEHKRFWFPLCDTTLEGIQKYDEDIWTECDIWHGAFEYENQKFVFGDGGMGNEGYIASTTLNGDLNWALFSTFSNPIERAEVINNQLICYGDTGCVIQIDLKNITRIEVSHEENK
jgi:hypothetical protein